MIAAPNSAARAVPASVCCPCEPPRRRADPMQYARPIPAGTARDGRASLAAIGLLPGEAAIAAECVRAKPCGAGRRHLYGRIVLCDGVCVRAKPCGAGCPAPVAGLRRLAPIVMASAMEAGATGVFPPRDPRPCEDGGSAHAEVDTVRVTRTTTCQLFSLDSARA